MDFAKNETLPFEKGKTHGHGLHGEVVEVTCRGIKLALKRVQQRPVAAVQLRETEVMKALSHHHVVGLVGTFYQAPYFGLLTWPVARFDLVTDLEFTDLARSKLPGSEADAEARMLELTELDNLAEGDVEHTIHIGNFFGCLTLAVAYLHRNNVRHKDIKPSNILIFNGGIRLTDFGAAKNYTLDVTSSSESRERGTLRYCAPEVAVFTTSGRSADIFSLGCVFLEILVATSKSSTFIGLEKLRPAKNNSYEANLALKQRWLDLVTPDAEDMADTRPFLKEVVKQMLDADRHARPKASQLALLLAGLSVLGGDSYHCTHCSRWFTQDPLANFDELEAYRGVA